MPKENIDYSNTVIYKIYCNDKTINDVYVGHTTNFTKRKHQHKLCCSNLNNNFKIYSTIREHGGWDNWNMIEIAKYNCKDKTEARIKEQEHYTELNSSLNSCPPYVDKNKYFCSTCNINCTTKNVYETHVNCSLHNKTIQLNNELITKTQKNAFYFCEICEFKTDNKTDYNRHILTPKHSNNKFLINNNNEKTPQTIYFACHCGKEYKYKSGLCAHKKKCFQKEEKIEEENKIIIEPNNDSNIISPDLIIEIIKQNQEFKDLLLEQNKTIIELSKNSSTTNNTINNNSHNKTFNLQVFLNETCKDAMNIMDFVDSIKIQLCDIESIGELGFVNGMSKLIIKHLNALDENMRPVHCSDPKRDSLYVKDQNVWEKEGPDNNKIKKAIKYISHKNICALPEWKAKYPDCIYSDSLKSDQYNHIVLEAMGGSGDNDAEKADKIVKKISKVVTINK